VPLAVLGDTTAPKHIYVDLTNQKLYAYEGDKVVMSFMVSTGKWNHTPTGDFKIWIKLRYTRMTGGSGADYYNLPNVPYTMFYYNDQVPKGDGYSIHGAYWHNNFGHPMSHGCVNMRPADAGLLYAWANPPTTGNVTYATDKNPGTVITVYGETPAN
jgi:lipoprotein-anchoring transpeptidase ErfK/SrfK